MGHKWRTNGFYESGQIEQFVCERCNMTRTATVTWSTGQNTTANTVTVKQLEDIAKKTKPKETPVELLPWVCFYCGAVFDDEDTLLDHEDDCAEA
jgi:predicted Zn-ribbon and HTH transcriptional regulator